MRRRRRRGGEPAPSFFQSLHKERQLPPEHKGEPQLPVDGPSQKDPAPNGCLSTLLVKIILHIFCMSLTVSIKPRPLDWEGEEDFCCGFPLGHGEEEAGEAQGRLRRGQPCRPIKARAVARQPIRAQAVSCRPIRAHPANCASQWESRRGGGNEGLPGPRRALLVSRFGIFLKACCSFYFDYFIIIVIFLREKGVFTAFCNHRPFLFWFIFTFADVILV